MAYGNPRFSELGKVLTKVALERSRMVLCSADWGAHGGNEYWRSLLDKLTLNSVQLPDHAIYVPLGRKTPIRKPGWGSMLKVLPWVVDGAGGLGAGKTSGAGTRGVDLNAAVGGRTGYTDTNGGESSNNGSKIHVDCYPAENPSL